MKSMTYKSAGVDINAKTSTLGKLKELTRSTFSSSVLTDIGLFGGLYSIPPSAKKMKNPVMVSSVDGVGTKLKIAFLMKKHDTVGIDLVSHCVNDILVQGARPLFFMDYLAMNQLNPDIVVEIVRGLTRGCKESDCSLIGGETAEMPDFYQKGEYDLAGFILGMVDKEKIIDGRTIEPGDRILGLASSGLHTNGYSLARKVIFEIDQYKISDYIESLGTTVGKELLKPHKSYLKPLMKILDRASKTKSRDPVIKGMAHITGGGFYDNIPRILPQNCYAKIFKSGWFIPDIFQLIQKDGKIPDREMYHVFNMGIGLVLVVSQKNTDFVLKTLLKSGQLVYLIGEIGQGKREVRII